MPTGPMPRNYRHRHLACLHGCLRHVGVGVTPGWLFGVTGHAFLAVDVSADAHDPAPVARAAAPLGARVEIILRGGVTPPEATCASTLSPILDAMAGGVARYAYDAVAGDYFCVTDTVCGEGRDIGEARDTTAPAGPKVMTRGWVASVASAAAGADIDAIRAGLRCAVGDDLSTASALTAAMAEPPSTSSAAIRPDGVLAERIADVTERRAYAVEFLWEAKERLRGQQAALFNAAAEEYDRVARLLAAARAGLARQPHRDGRSEREAPEVRGLLADAQDAETHALKALRELYVNL